MIDEYSVATTLTLHDELIIGLQRAAAVADELDASLIAVERRLATLGGNARLTASLDSAKASAVTLNDSLKTLAVSPAAITDLRSVSRLLGNAERRALALKQTLATLTVPPGLPSQLPGLPGGGGRGGPGGRGGGGEPGGPHITGASAPLPGGMHASTGRLSPEAAVGAGIVGTMAYGAYKEAGLRDDILKMLFTAGMPLRDDALFQRIRTSLLDISTSTGAPIGEVSEAGLGITRMLSGFPMERRVGVFDSVIKAAVEEHRLKGDVSVPAAAEAIIGMLHQARIYDPTAIEGAIGSYLYSSIVSPQNIAQIGRAASYATPVLRAGIGYDPIETTMLMAQLQQAGISSTKAGTWEERGLEGLLPNTVNLTSHAAKMHMAALRRLGLIDERGKSTILDEHGHPSLTRELTTVSTALEKIPQSERMEVLKQVGLQQGSRFLAIATDPQFIAQRERLAQDAQGFTRWREFFPAMFGASPVQQSREAVENLSRLAQDVGSTALAPFSDAVKTATTALEGLNRWAEGRGMVGTAAQMGAVGGMAGLAYAGWRGLSALWRGGVGGTAAMGSYGPLATVLAGVAAESHIREKSAAIDTMGKQDWLDRALGWGPGGFWGPGAKRGFLDWSGIVRGAHAEALPGVGAARAGDAAVNAAAQGADKIVQAINAAAARTEAATKALVPVLQSGFASVAGAVRTGMAAHAHEMSRPPGDAGSFDGSLSPLYPAMAR